MNNYNFSYLIDKIERSNFQMFPFKHIYLENFFSPEHFKEILESSEIKSPLVDSDDELIDQLYLNGYKIIGFPGCVTDRKKYIKWHRNGKGVDHHSACEGFGMALRLYNFSSPILKAINDFIVGKEFNTTIARKFGIDIENCSVDGGIQKYLDGYEISPHPDTRLKAATFMVNINPDPMSELMNHHTQYMRFNPSKEYVKQFWEGNPKIDRAWVPWDWATTEKEQNKNNSIVLFSPDNDTLHAVKADYNHLQTQRTQLYGNLWYKVESIEGILEWEDLDLANVSAPIKRNTPNHLRGIVSKILPRHFKKTIRTFLSQNELGIRKY